MKSVNQLNLGSKIKIKNLKTFEQGFMFDFFSHLTENRNTTYERTQLRVYGVCGVKNGDTVCINSIMGHGWERYRSKNGYVKYPYLIVDITNLTPPKIEW